MDIAKLRLPAWTENDGQRQILHAAQVQADMNEAAAEIERLLARNTTLEAALREMIDEGERADWEFDQELVERSRAVLLGSAEQKARPEDFPSDNGFC